MASKTLLKWKKWEFRYKNKIFRIKQDLWSRKITLFLDGYEWPDQFESLDAVEEFLIPDLVAVGWHPQQDLGGASFCFTGKMARTRDEMEDLVTQNNGLPKRAVTEDLDYLVQSDPNSVTVKTADAMKFGISVISEQQFLDMVGEW